MFFIYLKVLLLGQLHLSYVFLGFPLSKLRPVVGYDGLDAHLVMHVGDEFFTGFGSHPAPPWPQIPPRICNVRIGPNPTRGCVDEVSFHALLPIRDRISAAPPRCSPDAHPARESVYPENNRGNAETPSRTGADHGN